ncbi:MAG: DUF4214 domain-containing protein [Lachnospiraceae bacterium]|nr:DUF4214 domain-containing protein [Lachnospiraceae bacterium]
MAKAEAIQVGAANTVWQYDYVYTLNSIDHTITVTKYVGQSLDITVPATARVNDIEYHTQIKNNSTSASMWGKNISKISFEDGVKAISCTHLFYGCTGLTTIDLRGLRTGEVQNYSDMFTNCIHLARVDFTGMDTHSAQDFHSMFRGCAELTEVIWGGIDTSKVVSTVDMFNGCGSLTSMDLTPLNLNNVTKSASMFYNCSKIERFYLQNWDMSGNFNGDNMFTNCNAMLSIDTPTNLTVEIRLPVTLIDAQKAQYDRLPTRRGNSMHLVVPTDGAARRAWIEAFVRRFYTVALERKPDTQGFLDWCDSLDRGNNDGAGIGQGFILSDEFCGKNLSNVDYLVTLYRTFFDREPDEEGYAYWLGQMRNGVKRKVVLAGFINSKEFANVCADYGIKQGFMRLSDEDMAISDDVYQERLKEFIERMYLVALNREGEESGVYYWMDTVMTGDYTLEELAMYGFYLSAEYQNRGRTDEEFVEDLYLGLFNREADPLGKAHWLRRLGMGESRKSIIYGFSRSEEFSDMLKYYGF